MSESIKKWAKSKSTPKQRGQFLKDKLHEQAKATTTATTGVDSRRVEDE